MSDELTPEEIHDRAAWLKDRAREGAKALHARATGADDKRHKPTPTEELARARARADRDANR